MSADIDTEGKLLFQRLINELDAASTIEQDDTLDHAVEKRLALGLGLVFQFTLAFHSRITLSSKLRYCLLRRNDTPLKKEPTRNKGEHQNDDSSLPDKNSLGDDRVHVLSTKRYPTPRTVSR